MWPKKRMTSCAATHGQRLPWRPWWVWPPAIYSRNAPEPCARLEETYGKFRRCEAQVFQSPAVARFYRCRSRVGDIPVHGDISDGSRRAAVGPSLVQRRRGARIDLAGRRGAGIELSHRGAESNVNRSGYEYTLQ